MKKKLAKKVYTLADLQNWREATRDVDPPTRLGVFGDPIEHSLSPQMQNAALRDGKIDMHYARFHIRTEELKEALSLLRTLDFVGINLTVPHKIAALQLIDQADDATKQIGAINTILVESGKLIGFNTDAPGFARAIRSEFSVDLRDLRVLVLGVGGVGRAIALQCARENCERLVLINRDFEKAKALAQELTSFFSGARVLGPVARLEAVPWKDDTLRFQIANTDLVVNATSLGMNRNEPSPLPSSILAPHLMIYDTIYTAERTSLLAAAADAGSRGANGLSMLLHQGALAFEIWFKREAPIDVMRKALL
jgi:shikimate dehydrogenase